MSPPVMLEPLKVQNTVGEQGSEFTTTSTTKLRKSFSGTMTVPSSLSTRASVLFSVNGLTTGEAKGQIL